ncbi:hypothetical protein H351_06910 [Rhodococcus erythropolis R138]|nr:hypothetical protein H351_06910 [Rhodococcus erythropolis R138]
MLGEYVHHIDFEENSDFVIIYGPNGVGKTKFLEIIHALSRVNAATLSLLPFGTATLSFSDGHSITAITDTHDEEGDSEFDAFVENGQKRKIRFELHFEDSEKDSWLYSGDNFEAQLIENTTYRPLSSSPEIWEDRVDQELVSLTELERRFPDFRDREDVPEWIERFRENSFSYLIETQRLRIEQYIGASRRVAANIRPGVRRKQHDTKISEHSSTMKALVNRAQTEHSRITQQLDRTFPNKVLAAPTSETVHADDIRIRFDEQNGFRSRLGRVASVALEDELSLPTRDLDEWELRLLSLYLDDADKKLAPFVKLLRKIELLEDIVNSRLLNKRLQVTAGEGLTVRHETTGRAIDLNSLSSGEQHEIILIFDLLFNVPEGALVLIDEPEISLHVVWQLAFIPDVQRVAELAGFRFIVATHSPQIINDAWSHAVRLGPEKASFA